MLDAKNVKIGFIGFGNMAQAMAAGLLLRQAVQPGQLYACAKKLGKAARQHRAAGDASLP